MGEGESRSGQPTIRLQQRSVGRTTAGSPDEICAGMSAAGTCPETPRRVRLVRPRLARFGSLGACHDQLRNPCVSLRRVGSWLCVLRRCREFGVRAGGGAMSVSAFTFFRVSSRFATACRAIRSSKNSRDSWIGSSCWWLFRAWCCRSTSVSSSDLPSSRISAVRTALAHCSDITPWVNCPSGVPAWRFSKWVLLNDCERHRN